jgi:hypothetical protein
MAKSICKNSNSNFDGIDSTVFFGFHGGLPPPAGAVLPPIGGERTELPN